MLEDNNLADVPIVVAAIDPCFSCTDRGIQVMDLGRGRDETLGWGALRAHGIEWWRREAGVDFSSLNRKLSQSLAAR